MKQTIEQAVILVGGEGIRLRPLTLNKPKSLVPILNIPFLFWMLSWLAKYGVKEVILATGYLSSEFGEICKKFSRQLNINVIQVVEPKPLGTAGAIKFVEKYLKEEFLAFNGDIFTQFNLNNFMKKHRETGSFITIAVTPVENPGQFGVVEHDGSQGGCGRISKFLEKPAPHETAANEINAGIYLMNRTILKDVASDIFVSLERDVFPKLISDGVPMFAYPMNYEYWIDIGTHDKYCQTHWDLLCTIEVLLSEYKNIFSDNWKEIAKGVVAQGDGELDLSAINIIPPLVIGKSVRIAKNVSIGPNVVIGDDCEIEDGVTLSNSILWNNCKVGKMAKLDNIVLGDCCQVDPMLDLCKMIIPTGTHLTQSNKEIQIS